MFVCERSRPENLHAGHAARRERFTENRDPRQQSGARPGIGASLQLERIDRARRSGVAHPARRSRIETRRKRRLNYLLRANCPPRTRRRRKARRGGYQRGDSRSSLHQTARRKGDLRFGRQNAPRRDCRTGPAVLRSRRRKFVIAFKKIFSINSTPPSCASRRRKFPCLTTRLGRKLSCRAPTN